MKTWQDQKIGTRLGVVFGIILLCVIAAGAFGLNWLGRLNSNMSASMQRRYNTVELTHQTIENSITNARITLQLFEVTNLDEEKKLNQENEAISHEISTQVAESKRASRLPRSGICLRSSRKIGAPIFRRGKKRRFIG